VRAGSGTQLQGRIDPEGMYAMTLMGCTGATSPIGVVVQRLILKRQDRLQEHGHLSLANPSSAWCQRRLRATTPEHTGPVRALHTYKPEWMNLA
jgi:hypothetical protein